MYWLRVSRLLACRLGMYAGTTLVVFCTCASCRTAGENERCSPREPYDAPCLSAAMDVDEIQRRIERLPEWPHRWRTPILDEDEWLRIVELAQQLQRQPVDKVRRALVEYISSTDSIPFAPTKWSKVFLLLRVMFDLPDEAYDKRKPERPQIAGGGFGSAYRGLSAREIKKRGMRLSWPISWRDGIPQLECRLGGYNGSPYDVDAEFSLLLKHYGFRDLHAVAEALRRKREAETHALP